MWKLKRNKREIQGSIGKIKENYSVNQDSNKSRAYFHKKEMQTEKWVFNFITLFFNNAKIISENLANVSSSE